MPHRAAALLAAAAFLALVVPTGEAASTEVAIRRLSYEPVPGDYTFIVKVDNFELAPPNASAPRNASFGQIHFLLNGQPCGRECSAGASYRTAQTHFTYHRLVAGDNLTAELRLNNGNRTIPPVSTSVVVVPLAASQGIGPFLSVASGIPNAGDYRLEVTVERFTLLPPGTEGEDTEGEGPDAGHLRYTRNGAPCQDACAAGQANETDSTSFTFHGVAVGDRLSAELVRPDGSPLAPRTLVTVLVARPSIRVSSGVAQEGEYEMQVQVLGFTLAAPGSPANAGTGHIVYQVRREGTQEFVAASCDEPARTASTTFTFCDLEEGDQVAAELVTTSGSRLDPPVRTNPVDVNRLPQEGFFSPGVGPVLAILLLALALVRRPR